MKTNFDKKNPKRFLGYLMASALVFFTGSVTAQTNHDVLIDSQTNTFTPASLTIDVGDQVTFTNDGGFHNVNGNLSTYPNNADSSLYSGAASNSLTTYVWVCTTAGNYDYQCDPHVGLGMVGTIAANAPPTACAFDELTVTLYDSYGDGGGSIDVDGNVLTNSGSSNSMVVCVDLSGCVDVTFAATDSWSYENSWDVTDASGAVLASGGAVSGNVGNCAPPPVLGCMDPAATNYDAAADTDDGSCVYPCLDNAVVYTAGSYAGENSFTITDCDGNILADMALYTGFYDACLVLPPVYSVNLSDSYGDSWNGGSLSIDGVTYTLDGINDDGSSASFQVGVCTVLGCTDATATNYDASANSDDGSCTYPTVLTITTTVCDGASSVMMTGTSMSYFFLPFLYA